MHPAFTFPRQHRTLLAGLVAFTLLTVLQLSAQAGQIDLRKAIVWCPTGLSGPENKAVHMLVEEMAKRTRIRWPIVHAWPADAIPVIAVGPARARTTFGTLASKLADQPDHRAEGYRILVDKKARNAATIVVIGNDPRGVLFGVGRLLRALDWGRDRVTVDDDLNLTSAPRYRLRGHQLGYRPKTNSYDGWTLALWEQYIRDLAIFGTNAVELIPPRSDDDADSPHFPLPPLEMMVGMSKLLDDYGLDVWIWYPAMDRDYSDPATVARALKEWAVVFEKLPRIDAIFVPGGDPGHTRPTDLLALLEKETRVLHRFHPKAQMWVSPQSFNQEWLDEFCTILQKEKPSWLAGVVYGPQVRVTLPQLRKLLPARYPIRRYPDITHSRQCQYPVPDWDMAYALTEARECINPRPEGTARIFRIYQHEAIGFISYSEGCNDDVNKMVWSSLGWDPDTPVLDILRQYSGYFLGDSYRDSFAQGLLALERNWQGPLLTNGGVYTTLEQFQQMEKHASPQALLNWRFQQGLYRAYYDAYERSRLLYETNLEDRAMGQLRRAVQLGPRLAMRRAEAILDRSVTEPVARDWRAHIFELGEALFQSIRMQLSVPRYQAIAVDRGANLDTIDTPLNNRLWLKARFAELSKLGSEAAQRRGLDQIINWTNPGPGGFYDDLGDLAHQPHLLRGAGFDADPSFRQSSLMGFVNRPTWRRSWCRHAESLLDAPLQMHYTGL
ncbi:MAG TPA: hypothetical protein VFA18_19475, partial [Gemmataceae bacterium]|nr:hypothetical protein [Gemmataceae bacterium]